MGTQYSWASEREKAAEAFGGRYPDAELEAELLEVFRERPAFVVDAIADVVGGFKAGRIKSPWPFLRKRVGESAADVVVDDASERERKVKAAEQWIRSAGLHFDRWAEVEQVLFGPAELTAPLEQLVALELEMRGAPGRYMYEGLLKAAIVRTRQLGPQEIPDSQGRLRPWDSPELREQMQALYVEQRPRGLRVEQEELVRMGRYREDARRLRGEADWVGEEPPVTVSA